MATLSFPFPFPFPFPPPFPFLPFTVSRIQHCYFVILDQKVFTSFQAVLCEDWYMLEGGSKSFFEYLSRFAGGIVENGLHTPKS